MPPLPVLDLNHPEVGVKAALAFDGGVYIRMSHLGPADVAKRFKGMVKRCADCGFDLAGGLVEVVPTAHYLMGGVVCDDGTGTALPGLFVAGEDAGGAHGANRLGGNGVANSTVFGGIAGDEMAAYVKGMSGHKEPDLSSVDTALDATLRPFGKSAGDLNTLRERLLTLMWDDVGVVRNAAGLERGIGDLATLKSDLMEVCIPDTGRDFNLTWHDWLNLKSLIEVSSAIAHAAVAHQGSRGAHFRDDHPDEGDLATTKFTVVRKAVGRMQVDLEPVDFAIVEPGQSLIDNPELLPAAE
jgi:fumarate reductase flavoprotein subunit